MESVIEDGGSGGIVPEEVRAEQISTRTITYRLRKRSITQEGEIHFTLPLLFKNPQIDDPPGPGFITVTTSNPNCLLKVSIGIL